MTTLVWDLILHDNYQRAAIVAKQQEFLKNKYVLMPINMREERYEHPSFQI